MLDYTIVIEDENEMKKAVEMLDDLGVDYDWDDVGRLITNQDGADTLLESDIDYYEM